MKKSLLYLLLLGITFNQCCCVLADNYPNHNDPRNPAYCGTDECNNIRKELKKLNQREEESKENINKLISTYKDPFIYDIAKQMNDKKVLLESSRNVSDYFEIQEEINNLENEMLSKLRNKYSEFNDVLEQLENYQLQVTRLNNKLEQTATENQAKDFLSDENLNLLKEIQNQPPPCSNHLNSNEK